MPYSHVCMLAPNTLYILWEINICRPSQPVAYRISLYFKNKYIYIPATSTFVLQSNGKGLRKSQRGEKGKPQSRRFKAAANTARFTGLYKPPPPPGTKRSFKLKSPLSSLSPSKIRSGGTAIGAASEFSVSLASGDEVSRNIGRKMKKKVESADGDDEHNGYIKIQGEMVSDEEDDQLDLTSPLRITPPLAITESTDLGVAAKKKVEIAPIVESNVSSPIVAPSPVPFTDVPPRGLKGTSIVATNPTDGTDVQGLTVASKLTSRTESYQASMSPTLTVSEAPLVHDSEKSQPMPQTRTETSIPRDHNLTVPLDSHNPKPSNSGSLESHEPQRMLMPWMLPGTCKRTHHVLEEATEEADKKFGKGQYGVIYFDSSGNTAWYFKIPHESLPTIDRIRLKAASSISFKSNTIFKKLMMSKKSTVSSVSISVQLDSFESHHINI